MLLLRRIALPLALACAACTSRPIDHLAGAGENASEPAGGTPPDAPSSSTPAAASSATPATPFAPAFAPSAPRLLNNGGPVLARPDIVTVTWEGDPNAARYEALGDAIGTTQYWHAITSEYGVGQATAGKHVRMSGRPGRGARSDLGSFVAAQAGNPASGWPAPTPQTVYVMYIPSDTTILFGGVDACEEEGGHHDDTEVNGIDVAYAVILQCVDDDGSVDGDEVTEIASHEIGEASLDPFEDALAWVHVDEDHIAYDLMLAFQNENADLCEFFPEAALTSPELPGVVLQRQWSNASAAAGHNPCVPAPDEPYFNVTPLRQDAIEVDLTGLVSQLADADFTDTSMTGVHATKGLLLDPNGDGQVELGLFSDAPTDAWQVDVFEMDPFAPLDGNEGVFEPTSNPTVTASLDRTTGKNGDEIVLSVRRVAAARIGASLLVVRSTLGASTHYFPILAGRAT